MAGNTKLIGFGARNPGKPGVIQLERWKGKVNVTISEASLESIRKACYEDLPEESTQRGRGDLEDFHLYYDEDVGRVIISILPSEAQKLSEVLNSHSEQWVDTPEIVEKVGFWVSELERGAQDHIDYHNAEGEPGVKDSN